MATVQVNYDAIATLNAKVTLMEANYNEALDTIWMLLAAFLVFFMHAGFSFLEAGCVRFKNMQHILAKNLIAVSMGFLCWYAVGFPLALGATEDPGKFAGFTNFFMDGFWKNKIVFRTWFFQGAFCATAGTIVSGAMAERTQVRGFAVYIAAMTAIIYPIVVYWGWSGNGWLSYTKDGVSQAATGGPAYMDFAGSGIVHMVGGVGALCGAVIVGPRNGRWEQAELPDGSKESFDAQSIPFCVLGTFFLWFGWYGFNCGSTLSMHDAGTAVTAGLVATNTTLAPCVAGLLVFILRAAVVPPKLLDVGGFCNGILAGLVSITAGCAFVKPWEAVIIGLIGGAVYQGTSMLMKKCKVDDVVDAVAVHGASGLWGIVALGFFGDPDEGIGGNGVFYGGNQLGTQLLAALVIILWTATLSVAVLLPLNKAGLLRLSANFQTVGADAMEHSPTKAYSQDVDGTEKTETSKV
jgi:Amt family ammonium transporter